MTDIPVQTNDQGDMSESTYILDSHHTEKKTLGQMKRNRILHDDNEPKYSTEPNSPNALVQEFPNTQFQNTPQPIDDMNIAHNIIIPTYCSLANTGLNESVNNFQHSNVDNESMDDPILLASSTPIPNHNYSFPAEDNSMEKEAIVEQTTEYSDNKGIKTLTNVTTNTMNDIVLKLSSLDDNSLALIQGLISQQRYANRSSTASESTIELMMPRLVPLCTIDQSKVAHPTQCEDEKIPIENSNNDHVHNTQNSVLAYMYNENADDVLKINILKENDHSSSYSPIDPIIGSEATSTEHIAVDCSPKKKESNKEKKFRSITAKWKGVRNRSLHTKFIKRLQPAIFTDIKRSDYNKRHKQRPKIHHKGRTEHQDPEYKPHCVSRQWNGKF